MFLFALAIVFLCDSLIAGRFDHALLNTASEKELIYNLRKSTLDHPIHTSVATLQKGHDKFAGVYIGNRMVLTAAHCLEGVSARGYQASFTTYLQKNGSLIEKVIASAKVLTWEYARRYTIGGRDYGLIVLDKDPVGIQAAKIWTHPQNKVPLPSRDGIIISPMAKIDWEEFFGFISYIRDSSYPSRGKHTYYTKLLFGNNLPLEMRTDLGKSCSQILASVMYEKPAYQKISNKIYGKTREGDSGSPIFVKSNGAYYLVGLVSGGYSKIHGVLARNFADLYVHLGNWYRKGKNALTKLAKSVLRRSLRIERKYIRTWRARAKKGAKYYKKIFRKHARVQKALKRTQKKLARYQGTVQRIALLLKNQKLGKNSKKRKKYMRQLKTIQRLQRKAYRVVQRISKQHRRSYKRVAKLKGSKQSSSYNLQTAIKRLRALEQGLRRFK